MQENWVIERNQSEILEMNNTICHSQDGNRIWQPWILYPAKLSFLNEVKIKTFQNNFP